MIGLKGLGLFWFSCTEPSAALCLTHEYPNLLGDEDSQLVADNTSEACDYLWRMHQAGKLELDLKPRPGGLQKVLGRVGLPERERTLSCGEYELH